MRMIFWGGRGSQRGLTWGNSQKLSIAVEWPSVCGRRKMGIGREVVTRTGPLLWVMKRRSCCRFFQPIWKMKQQQSIPTLLRQSSNCGRLVTSKKWGEIFFPVPKTVFHIMIPDGEHCLWYNNFTTRCFALSQDFSDIYFEGVSSLNPDQRTNCGSRVWVMGQSVYMCCSACTCNTNQNTLLVSLFTDSWLDQRFPVTFQTQEGSFS